MSKNIKTDIKTGKVVIEYGDCSFKQWGILPDIIVAIEELKKENDKLKRELEVYKEKEIAKMQQDLLKVSRDVQFSMLVGIGGRYE